MARGNSDTLLGPPVRGKEAAARPDKGRRCGYEGCSTVLSTYNRSETCFTHSAPTRRTALERS